MVAFIASLVLLAAQAAAPQPPVRDFQKLVATAVELHQAGDILGAIDAYSAALGVEPNHAGVRSNLGAAYVRLGKFDEAVEQYREALRIDPTSPTVRFNLGLAYYKAARLPDAIAAFEEVTRLAPDNAAAVLLLGGSFAESPIATSEKDAAPAADSQSHPPPDARLSTKLPVDAKMTNA